MAINLQNPASAASVQFSDPRQSGQGVVNVLPQSGPQPDTAIPSFLQSMAEPYIKQQQTEQFWKGYTEQLAAGSTNEAIHSESLMSKFFGPTAYEQGAGFAAGTARVQDMTNDLLNQKDELAKMDPSEFSSVVATRAKSLMTGNAVVDGIMQDQLVKSMGAIVSTVSKTRFEQQQFAAYQGQVNNIVKAGKQLEGVASATSTTSDPNDPQNSALTLAQQNFLGLVGKPYGMTDENYRKAINASVDNLLDGNSLHAFTLLKQQGLLDAMDPKDRDGVETKYQSAAKRAVTNAVIDEQNPALRNRIFGLDIAIQKSLIPGAPNPITADQVAKEMDAINHMARAKAGIDDDAGDIYSMQQIIDAGKGVIGEQASQARKQVERQQHMADELELEQRKQDIKDRNAQLGWASGNALGATANKGPLGASVEQMNTLAAQDLSAGRTDRVIANYQSLSGSFIAEPAAKMLQTWVATGFGKGYTNQVDKAVSIYADMDKQSPAAALAYFGTDIGPRLGHMVDMVQAGAPKEFAWQAAFGDKDTRAAVDLAPQLRKPVETAVKNFTSKIQPNFVLGMLGGPQPMNPSSQRAVQAALTEGVAAYMQARPGADPQRAAEAVYQNMQATGALEVYGKFAWRSPPNTQPLFQATGIPKDRFDGVFFREVDAQLSKVNPQAGGNDQDYTIARGPNGLVYVEQRLKDGTEVFTHFTVDDLKARSMAEAKETMDKATAWRKAIAGKKPGDPGYKSFSEYFNDSLNYSANHPSAFRRKYPNGMTPSQLGGEILNGLQVVGEGLGDIKG